MPDSSPSPNPPPLADHDLLRRFVQDADQSAFAEIVQRHQSLVMGVCRRVTGVTSDAEDAFQAVFLILARRPRSIRRVRSLSSWLYTVAWRTSLRLVRRRRRQSMETLTHPTPTDDPDPLEQIAADQHADVLHEELNLLPERYREVLVMTYFAQQTSLQIADQLQVSQGTIDGRIRQARNMLRVRLARRGVALSVLTLVATGFHSAEAASVPPVLLEATIQLGTQTLTHTVPGTTDLSSLESLVRPEVTVMNLKMIAAAGTCVAMVLGVAGMARFHGATAASADDFVAPVIDADGSGELPDVRQNERAEVTAVFASQPAAVSDDGPAVTTNATVAHPAAPAAQTAAPMPSGRVDARGQWLHSLLSQPIPHLEYRGETPLSEILDFLAEHYTQTYGRADDVRMTIWPSFALRDEYGIDSLDDVVVNEIRLEGAPLHQALQLIFEKTDGLTWDIREGVLEVVPQEVLEEDPRYRITRSYPIGSMPNLEDLVRDHLQTRQIYLAKEGEVPEDSGGNYGAISNFGGTLIVTHHRQAHEAVAEFLQALGQIPTHASTQTGSIEAMPASSSRRRTNASAPGYVRFGDHATVVNLNDERMTRFLSVSFAVRVDPELTTMVQQRMNDQMPVLKDWLLDYFAEKTLEDARGAAAQRRIRGDIHAKFDEVLFPDGFGTIKEVLFEEFAIQ